MNIAVKKTGERKTAVYATDPKGNKRMNVDGKFYTDKQFASLFVEVKTPEENVINTLKGKRMLFLENDNGLDNGIDEFQRILDRAGIENKVLFQLSKMPFDEIIALIKEYDGIVFMTQWLYEVSQKLRDFMLSYQEKKIVVECYINEPSFYYLPKSAHDVYIYSCLVSWGEPEKDYEKFYKLSKKSYWNYKNGFDK